MVDKNLLETCRIGDAENYTALSNNDLVKLRIRPDHPSSIEPISIPKILQQAVTLYGDRTALAFQDTINNKWNFITYRQYQEKVLLLAKIFMKLGLEARDSVGIFAFNSPEWYFTEMAVIHAGCIVAGIYTTNSAEAVYHILSTSNAKMIVVGNNEQMEKIRSIKHRLPSLKIIIQINDPFDDGNRNEIGYYRWMDIEKIDVNDMNEELNNRLRKIYVNECCCLIYTSGTVGYPKAVMLSHDCLTWNSNRVSDIAPKDYTGQHIYISYLPLSHMAAQIFDVFLPIIEGGCVYFADSNAFKGSLFNTMQIARPTRFFAVPRIWEKLQDYLISIEEKSSKSFQLLLKWARNIVLNSNLKIMKRESYPYWKYYLAEKIVRTMKFYCGLDRCEWFITGAAPTNPETKEYFLSLNIKIIEVFGMSETSGVISLGDEYQTNFETAGKFLPGIIGKIHNPNENGHGEICVKTRSAFMGYLDQLDKTKELIDEDDWIHTGDIGYIDNENYLYITGRLKELIITSGGENIPPIFIENLIKNELPGISNVILIGDKKKFLSVLLTIKTEIDQNTGEPLDYLRTETLEWMNNLGVQHKNLTDIINAGPCPIVLNSIQQGINRANQNAISNAQKVQKFAILPHDFSIPTGELGPTLKIKRNFIINKYQHIIDEFYK